MSQSAVTVEETPAQGDLDELHRQLKEYNRPYLGWVEYTDIAFVLKDPEGRLVGGVFGSTALGWLEIYHLWVRDDLRGQGYGRALMERIETAAAERGCTQVLLDTFDFQAPNFYCKLNYQEIASLEYGEHRRYFLKKRLQRSPGSQG